MGIWKMDIDRDICVVLMLCFRIACIHLLLSRAFQSLH